MDDILVSGTNPHEISILAQQLHKVFALKDLGEMHYFLGIEKLKSSTSSIHLSQKKYV